MNWITHIEEINEKLAVWDEGKAILWGYMPTFQILSIRLTHPNIPGNLHISCSPCLKIQCPVSWKNIHLHVVVVEVHPTVGPTFQLVDEANEVHIFSGKIDLTRDVEPIYNKKTKMIDL